MAKTGQDALFYKKNRVILRFTVVDEDVVGEPPLNITTFTIKYSIARFSTLGAPLTATPVIDLSSTGAQVVKTDPVNGKVEVTLTPTLTDLLAPGVYYHELEVFDASGNGVVSAVGNVTVEPNVVNA